MTDKDLKATPDKPAKSAQAAKRQVVLLGDHTHKGERKKAGDPITVTPAQAEWLKAKKLID